MATATAEFAQLLNCQNTVCGTTPVNENAQNSMNNKLGFRKLRIEKHNGHNPADS